MDVYSTKDFQLFHGNSFLFCWLLWVSFKLKNLVGNIFGLWCSYEQHFTVAVCISFAGIWLWSPLLPVQELLHDIPFHSGEEVNRGS